MSRFLLGNALAQADRDCRAALEAASAAREELARKRELATGVVLIYRLNADSTVTDRQELPA